ncbi:MAG: ParB/RepB/Spo0J family partition protein [Candidatus Colwellbacteria bacterium]|nr:ParB/RepB/Spo0J family partition protein [Candidatus Colwellbacteria bacterium]
MLGKGLESLIPSGGYKKPDETAEGQNKPIERDPSYFNYQKGDVQWMQPGYETHNPASAPIPAQNPPVSAFTAPAPVPAPVSASYPPVRPYENNQPREPLPAEPPERDITPYGYPSAPREVDDYSVKQGAVFQIEVDKIFPNPHQPRRYFDEGALNELANSIREFGIIQPLVVTKIVRETADGTDVSYQLIAGERRLIAAKKIGLRTVPVIVKQLSMDRERLELAIIENIQRENLNPLEAARSYARLQDEFGLTQREIAIRMGKSRETIANSLRLLNLPSEVQKALEGGQINESHARLLLQVTDQAKQKEMFDSIVNFKPSVRELKARLKESVQKKDSPGTFINPELVSLQSRLEEILGTRVQINDEGEKGRITISYYSPEELNELINKLSGGRQY